MNKIEDGITLYQFTHYYKPKRLLEFGIEENKFNLISYKGNILIYDTNAY